MYSTYGLASGIVLYVLKKLHESQCVMRNGTIQIKLSSFSSRTLTTKTPHENQTHTKTSHQRETEDPPIDICIDSCGETKSGEACA